jgi:16S rRNA (cytosine967-C5)-methyltransferase
MLDSATLNNAARVLATITPELRADAALRKYLGLARRLGPREKRAISRAVFTYFRWHQWLDPKLSAQKQLEQADTLQRRFLADPKSIKPEALAARAVPDWLHKEMDLPAAYLRQLQAEPALWLRARPGAAASLAKTLGHCEPAAAVKIQSAPLDPTTAPAEKPAAATGSFTLNVSDALRYTGPQDLFLTPAFHAGAFEIQDLASQIVGLACAPKPKETWWDACAGEGGKMLHLADQMDNKGLIWASDRSTRRLETLKRRAARAHLFNFRTAIWEGDTTLPTKTKFDGILVDAPCSGVGTWQRNPHARWTTLAADVRELSAMQLALLNHVAGSLKTGGRLIYAVCTLTRSETTAVVSAFTAAHPELMPAPVFEGAGPAAESISAAAGPTSVLLWPHELNANGMFVAAWKKR